MMEKVAEIQDFDVIIIGAGPGGCSSALALKGLGLKVALIDKSEFPRDKVCGELMHRKAVETLNSIIPEFEQEFKKFPKTLVLKHTNVHFKGKVLAFDWQNESYTCPRLYLDNFLLETVRQQTSTAIFTGHQPNQITRDEQGITVSIKNSNKVFKGKVLIGADGAHSIVAKQFADKTLDRKHYLGAVRAYYTNITDLKPDTSEVFFNTKFQLNYVWVFPVEGNKANVGFGMLSSDISEKKINLKETFYEYFKHSPELAERFKNAEPVSTLEGFGVPLGSSIGTTSGDRFMLIGDAASLSNPLSGTGIGNAVLSGKLAAEQIIKCFEANDFSANFMKQYDLVLKKAIVDNLMSSYRTQRLLGKMPFMLDVVFGLGRFEKIKKYIQSMV